MRRRRDKTVPATGERVFFVVDGGPELEAQCAAVGRDIGIIPNQSSVTSLHLRAARWHPFAIIMTNEVYAGDPVEYEALAQDVGGEVVVVPSGGLSFEELKNEIVRALNAAMTQ